MTSPEYIAQEELEERIVTEERDLGEHSAKWQAVRQAPTVIMHGPRAHYVVARHGDRVIFFADDEDEFGVGVVAGDGTLVDAGFAGDLRDAVALLRLD